MRIIDEKGRLFGKINLIDFLVLILLFCLVPIFYFGYTILFKAPTTYGPERDIVVIETRCLLIKLDEKTLKQISVGDKEIDGYGFTIGEIISIGESSSYKYLLSIGEDTKVLKESDMQQLEVRIRLQAEASERGVLIYKNQLLQLNIPFAFNTDKYRVKAVMPSGELSEDPSIIQISKDDFVFLKSKKQSKTVELYAILKELDDNLLKEIFVGDKEVDKNGETVAEILSLGKKEANSLELRVGKDNYITAESSNTKQINVKMRLKCQIANAGDDIQFYFKGKMMKHNMPFQFKTDKYVVKALLAKTFEAMSLIKEKQKWVTLQVEFSGVRPEVASVVRKGDVQKDLNNETIGRINSVVNNAALVLTLKNNDFVTLQHPYSRDIKVSLDVQCMQKEGTYYFKNFPVKMGNMISFATDLYSITGTIVGMEIK